MSEERLLKLLENANVNIGHVEPRVIKAWFDTDCADLLEWICTSITEDCYLSAQEYKEFSELEPLPEGQVNKQMEVFAAQYPELSQTESCLVDIELAKDRIEILEEEQKGCELQIQINKALQQSLSSELSKVTNEEIQAEIEEESAQNNCLKLSKELDYLNSQIFAQMQKYGVSLTNYEFSTFPEFANKLGISEYQEKFADSAVSINTITTTIDRVVESHCLNPIADELTELECRILNSRISKISLQMEVEGLNSTLQFLENYHTMPEPHIYLNTVQSFINLAKDEQNCMLKVIEELSLKIAQQCTKQPTLKYLRNEAEFYGLKLDHIKDLKESVMKIMFQSVIMYNLSFEEKMDIKSSAKFFRKIHNYIDKDLKNCRQRKEAMLVMISQFEEFSAQPVTQKLKIIGDLALVSSNEQNLCLREILNSTNLIRSKTENLERKQFNCSINNNLFKDLCSNIQTLQKFLTSGPNSRIVYIPNSLQLSLSKASKTLKEQQTAIKQLIQMSKIPKAIVSRDEWGYYRMLLWVYFMTDGSKMLSFLEQLKNKETQKNIL